MSRNIEDLERAMAMFNESLSQKNNTLDANEISNEWVESMRIESIEEAINSLNLPNLNDFLLQETVIPHLDLLGVHSSNKKPIRGLKIVDFEIPRAERRFAHTLTLAYVSFPTNSNLFHSASQDFDNIKGYEDEIIVPAATCGLVFVKDVGEIMLKSKEGTNHKERKVHVITPNQFMREGIYETALNSNISASQVISWVDERFSRFTQLLIDLSNQ